MNLEKLHELISTRNEHETDQFTLVHQSNATLLNQVESVQKKCEALEREQVIASELNNNGSSAALRNETRLRDKLEKLQEELNKKLSDHQKDTSQALETAKNLVSAKEIKGNLELKVKKLERELLKKDKNISHLEEKYNDAKETAKLAEKQYNGLKETIRSLQDENDVLKVENDKLIDRLVSDKEKTSDEVNILNEMTETLKKENDMLHTLKIHDEKRRSWFAKPKSDEKTKILTDDKPARRFDTTGSIVPSVVNTTIDAHAGDATYVCHNESNVNLVATCGANDSMVKIWDTKTGALRSMLRGGGVITACDIGNRLVVGGGSDKMCRVWNLQTERMVRIVSTFFHRSVENLVPHSISLS